MGSTRPAEPEVAARSVEAQTRRLPLRLRGVHGGARVVRADALLRRLLALADITAGLLAATGLVWVSGTVDQAFWAAVFAPAWVLLAKLHGLYDRDQRALRHLTVDELPSIVFWALTGTALLAALMMLTPTSA